MAARYEQVYSSLTGQPRHPKGKLGPVKHLPPRERKFVPSTDSSGERPSAAAGTLPALWNTPYPRNPFFTGREDVLKQLRDKLQVGQPQAISSLVGRRKKQTAVE